ncbi:MAG: amino acid--tRNA ligase-related protein [Candidatus Paceibacterota bacterium]
MTSIEDLKKVREDKINILKENGIDAYPSITNRTHELKEVLEKFDDLEKDAREIRVAGRIMSLRGQGKIFFSDIYDGTEKFQIVIRIDNNPIYTGIENSNGISLFEKTADIGDFIEVGGNVFVTKSGQKSVDVKDWRILTKSIAPIPDTFYGLKDEDERYRKRYLDLLLDTERKNLFYKKASFWNVAQSFFLKNNFLPVETPTLEITTGGAEARPFKTHHNDFDMDVFLRISVGELWQKRLMAAGFPKTFEIGRVFRNEGSSAEHLQEFTNLECYAAFMNLDEGRELVKELYQTLGKEVFGTTKFTVGNHEFDLADEWTEIDYVSHIKEKTGIDVLNSSEEEMMSKLNELGVKFEGKNKERMTDSLWKYCRKAIAGPAFLINHPKIVAPLSKSLQGDDFRTEMFQVILAGSEVGRAHAELNDPIEQHNRLNTQQDLIKSGDEEAMMKDDEFVEMLEHGMPPTFGFGFGERLFAFMAGTSVREAQLFPLMKPRDN